MKNCFGIRIKAHLAGIEAPMCDPLQLNRGPNSATPNLAYPLWVPTWFARAAVGGFVRRHTYSRIVSVAFVLLIACAPFGAAVAQTCPVSGSSVTLATGTCAISPNTVLNGSPGVHATTSAQITTNNVTINPFNGGSIGALAETNGVIVFSSGSSINGNWATAASAQTGGTIIFQSGSVINPASGGGGTALLANGVGAGGQPSQIIATGLSVNMNGGGGNVAAKAMGGGLITLNSGTTVNFAAGGGGNTGLWATGAGSQIVTNGATVNMIGGGGGDIGVRADTGANVTLSGSAVNVQSNGGGETGLMASGAGSSINGTNLVVNVADGGGGRGGFLQNGATISLNGGSVTTSGSGAYGFLFQAPGGVTNTLELSGTQVSSAADAFAVQGGTANIAATGSTVIGRNGVLLSASQNGGVPAAVTMTANSSNLTGAILTDGVSTSTVTLGNGTTWNMPGNSNTTNLTNNNSTINISAPTGDPTQLGSYKTLTTTNYTGAGGNIVLNTYLGADGSPSDRLIINGGTATGTTYITDHNTTGPGAQTTNNGILVVDAINGATTSAGAFALAGEARGGAFSYRLFQGGIDGASTPNDWYLRSTFPVPPIPPGQFAPQVVPPLALPNGLPPDPPPAVLPTGLWPIIGPELATDGIVQPIARQMGLQTLGTLHQRIGDTLTLANTGGDGTGIGRSDWARFFGQGIDNRYQAFADPRASGWTGGFQGGVDLLRSSFLPGQRDVAGVYLAFANSDINVQGLVTNAAATGYTQTRTGTLGLNSYSAGGYWTHYGPSGWYLDAVVQGTYYNGNAMTQYANLPLNGSGFISSLEGGYPIPLPLGPRFVLEPQAQIIWQQVSFSQANDGLGPVGLGTTSGPTGRVGLRGAWTIDSSNGQVWQPYVRTNLWRDWGAQATTVFGGNPVPLVEEATQLEFAGGLSAKIGPGISLYAQAGYQFALDGAYIRNGVQGDIGMRYVW
jgi:outer membrane autotransporter protein